MNTLAYRREIDEAVDAANYAIKCLRKAHDELNGAKNWGIVDILGGGMLTTFLKRNKMNNAESDIAVLLKIIGHAHLMQIIIAGIEVEADDFIC